jgi:transposase-like protein
VAESFERPRAASETARRYGITPGLLFTWRRLLAETQAAAFPKPTVIPVRIADPLGSAKCPVRIEIILQNGVRLFVEEGVDPVGLRRIVAALDGR